jgi:diguanylate cyclase (GGDEF)-like protein
LLVVLCGGCLLLGGIVIDDRLRRLSGGSHAPFADRLTGICSRDTADLAFEAAMAALRAERQTLKQILAHEGIILSARQRDTGMPDMVTGCAVAVFDIGGLHDINRRYGRREGDRLLRRVAGSVAAHASAGDVPFRAGPDEIGVILPGRDAEGAAALARRMLDSALEQAALGRIPSEEITIDLGVAIAHGEEDLDTACAIALDLIHDRFHNNDSWSDGPSDMDAAMNLANTAQAGTAEAGRKPRGDQAL